jgi:hypothetical protein
MRASDEFQPLGAVTRLFDRLLRTRRASTVPYQMPERAIMTRNARKSRECRLIPFPCVRALPHRQSLESWACSEFLYETPRKHG